jgi:hypothetical protein
MRGTMAATARKFATREEAFAFVLKSGPTPEAKAVAKKWFIDIDDLGWASLKDEAASFVPKIQSSVESKVRATSSVANAVTRVRRIDGTEQRPKANQVAALMDAALAKAKPEPKPQPLAAKPQPQEKTIDEAAP